MPRQTTNQTKKKKRVRKQAEEHCSYLIEILSAKFRYSISENRGKKTSPGPYSEYPAIEMIGRGVEPPKIADKGFDCTIYGSREQDECLTLAAPEILCHRDLSNFRVPVLEGKDVAYRGEIKERISCLLRIHKALRMLFPYDQDLAYKWVNTKNMAFKSRPPIEIMKEGVDELRKVVSYLEWQLQN